ncbi:MAG: hypothetical protein QXZ51_00935 [Candidatus Bathyarchaeia archaeon]
MRRMNSAVLFVDAKSARKSMKILMGCAGTTNLAEERLNMFGDVM